MKSMAMPSFFDAQNRDIDNFPNLEHWQFVTILSFETFFRIGGLIACFYLLIQCKGTMAKIREPAPWRFNYDETYCVLTLKLVKMVNIQLKLMILIFLVGAAIDIFMLIENDGQAVNVLIWFQWALSNANQVWFVLILFN